MVSVIDGLANSVLMIFAVCYVIVITNRRYVSLPSDIVEPSRALVAELKPFYLTVVLVRFATESALYGAGISPGFNLALGLASWWAIRRNKDDDDRWKRRRERLASRVAQLGGRLAVVPT